MRVKSGRVMRILFLGGLLILATSVVAQTECREANGRVVERRDGFTILSITLPSQPSSLAAIAVVANSHRRTGAYVFTLSKLLVLDPQRSTEMLPAAIQLASEGHSSILLKRILTWPNIDDTVGQMKRQALCAEQWLSTHAATKPDDWSFIGPIEDVPSFEQLRDAGDTTSMTFHWGLPLAGYRDMENTENVLQKGLEGPIAALTRSHELNLK
jgi:hypothetical protein